MLTVVFYLGEDIEELEGRLLDTFRLHLNSVFKRAAGAVKRRMGEICESLIENTEEYKSLLSGELLGELGIPNVGPRLENILRTIKNSVDVETIPFMKVGDNLSGGIVVKMIKEDFQDILGLPDSHYETEKSTTINWLDWLLTQGDRIIVVGYDVLMPLKARQRGTSRTGLALMRPGSGWRIPSEFSGVLGDNFITRAFNVPEVKSIFLKVFEEEIVKRL